MKKITFNSLCFIYDSGTDDTYLSQGRNCSDYNRESLQVDCGQFDYPFAMSDDYIHLSAEHSSEAIGAQFAHADSSIDNAKEESAVCVIKTRL